jgi:hypothetical protein
VSFEPITIVRVDADHYIVGFVTLTRIGTTDGGVWAALPPGKDRPLFTANTLEEILDMAHGACEMMRPAPGYCRHYKQGDCDACDDEMVEGMR